MLWLRSILYPVLFCAFFVIALPMWIADQDRNTLWTLEGRWLSVASVAIGVGGAIVVWCVQEFALIGRGTPAPFDPPRHLVTSGPYARVRNPIYLGAILIFLGELILFGSRNLALYLLAWVIGIHFLVVLYEEPTLRRDFGAAYDRYCSRAGRWLPQLRRRDDRSPSA